MRALCMITVKPGRVDDVADVMRNKKHTKNVMIVAGRADICVLLQGSINEINRALVSIGNIDNIASTETLIEMDVDLGW